MVEAGQFAGGGFAGGQGGHYGQALLAVAQVGMDGFAGDRRVSPDAQQIVDELESQAEAFPESVEVVDPALGAGGKAIRPALVLLSARAAGGTAETALPAAVAVELAHNFSLLHDDLMDGDLLRRHRPTTWAVFGGNAALLAGDALLACAFEAVAKTRHPAATQTVRILARAVLDLVEGQSTDMAFERRADVTLPECLAMAANKTAALLGGACAIGAAHGSGPEGRVDHFHRFGQRKN